jgi:PIN domain nuclease of toxin-antitoxin system
MKYLLDTNVFLFLITEQFKLLSKNQIDIIFNSSNEIYISEASLFEIGIKARIGKESFSHIDINRIEKDRKASNIKLLKSKPDYYLNIPNVPKILISENKLHGDPFDLLIISQAIFENFLVLSTDRLFPLYKGLITIS